MRSQTEPIGDLLVTSDQDGTLAGRDAEAAEQSLTLSVGLQGVPAEWNEVALQQLTHRERITRPARPDETVLAVPVAGKPLSAGNHRSQDEIAELRGADDNAPQRVGRDRKQRSRLGRHPRGNGRLTGEHRDVADERPRSALREVARPFG